MKKTILYLSIILVFLVIIIPSLGNEEEYTINHVKLTILNDTLYAIDLDNNGYSFPTYIYKYDSCKILRMYNCYYEEIPKSISIMKGLEEIKITKCFNFNFSKTFQNLCNNNISKLSLINDSLKKIPLEIQYLPNLKDLDLSNNQISVIPKVIFYLRSLNSIDFSENNISSFELTENNMNIKSLDLVRCNLTKLPSGIEHLCNLKFLQLADNKNLDLQEICDMIPNFENLEILNIIGCKKTKIPDNIENLKIVKKGIMTFNMFTDEEITLLRSKGIKI